MSLCTRLGALTLACLISTSLAAQTTQPAHADVMAMVDGVALPMSDLNDILAYSYGLPMAQQLVANELVRQEAVRKKVQVGLAEIKAENDLTLPMLFPEIKEASQREKALQLYMQNGRVTQKQWDMTMERNAILRKLAQGMVKVTDDDLQHAFGMKYNRQVVVRHIEVATVADAEAVLKDLLGGVKFEQLVQKRSESPSRLREGMLDPISASSTNIPPAVKEAALNLKKIGQVSNTIQAGTRYHILKLEKVIEPDKVRFVDVKESLYKELFEQKVQQQQMKVLEDLIRQAESSGKIVYVNPILAKLDQESRRPASTSTQPAKR